MKHTDKACHEFLEVVPGNYS